MISRINKITSTKQILRNSVVLYTIPRKDYGIRNSRKFPRVTSNEKGVAYGHCISKAKIQLLHLLAKSLNFCLIRLLIVMIRNICMRVKKECRNIREEFVNDVKVNCKNLIAIIGSLVK